MRLIDADALEEDLLKMHERREMNSRDRELIAYCISHVRQQPTAYDVDRVVKRLEELKELAYKRYMDCPLSSPCYVRYQTQYTERKTCSEIVKAGGVNE